MGATIRFRLNGRPVSLEAGGGRTLLWALRGELALTGTKYGCGGGYCGACAVLLDEQAVPACITPLDTLEGRSVVTIEGLAGNGRAGRLQQAFIDHGAVQCGYCTPGMIIGAQALLRAEPQPSREAIARALEGHLCRCGAHQRIVAAVEAASTPQPKPHG
jgi:aerobic-type carbon monoxide dehydrogenase small subunit (CoxS/CutS family)